MRLADGKTAVQGCHEWAALKEACNAIGQKPCGNPLCKKGVLRMAEFSKNKVTKDGKTSVCSTCTLSENAATTTAFRKQRADFNQAEDASADEVKDNSGVEDRLAAAICDAHPELFVTNPEFRRADMLMKHPGGGELLARVQLKSSESSGRKAVFSQCRGYGAGEDEQDNAANRMVVVLGLKPPGAQEYTLWVLDGATVPSDDLSVNTSTLVLSQQTLNMSPNVTMVDLPSKIVEVANSIATSGGNCLSTLRDSFFDIPAARHRKTVAGILALESIGSTVEFPTGNQCIADCIFDGTNAQMKMFNLKAGIVPIFYNHKGKRNQSYHEDDAIDTVVIHSIAKSADDFWLLHAVIPKWKLVKEDVFCRGPERKGGNKSLALPLGDLGKWLVGRPIHSQGVPDWRSSPLFGWRPPVRVYPSE
eukprot:7381896-Prymnesium_polylepis.1